MQQQLLYTAASLTTSAKITALFRTSGPFCAFINSEMIPLHLRTTEGQPNGQDKIMHLALELGINRAALSAYSAGVEFLIERQHRHDTSELWFGIRRSADLPDVSTKSNHVEHTRAW